MSMFHIANGKITKLLKLLVDQLPDLYSAESQFTQALPGMAAAADAPALGEGFVVDTRETRRQIVRHK